MIAKVYLPSVTISLIQLSLTVPSALGLSERINHQAQTKQTAETTSHLQSPNGNNASKKNVAVAVPITVNAAPRYFLTPPMLSHLFVKCITAENSPFEWEEL